MRDVTSTASKEIMQNRDFSTQHGNSKIFRISLLGSAGTGHTRVTQGNRPPPRVVGVTQELAGGRSARFQARTDARGTPEHPRKCLGSFHFLSKNLEISRF